MKPNYFLPFLSFLLILFTACNDGAKKEDIPPVPFENSSLNVFVQIETDTGLVPAHGASIFLYENENDREYNEGGSIKGATDMAGKHSFTGLALHEYWITVTHPDDGRSIRYYDGFPFPTPGPPVYESNLNVVFGK